MALEQKIIKEAIKQKIENFLGDYYRYEAPFLFKEDDNVLYYQNIQASDIGLINVGPARIKYKQVESIVAPILIKHGINQTHWNSTIVDTSKFENRNNLANLKADSEAELKESLLEMQHYIEVKVIPFWNMYDDITKVIPLINSKTEQELNQGVFQGVTGIMNRLVIAYKYDMAYYKEKKEMYLDLIGKQAVMKPNDYGQRFEAFKELIETLEKLPK